VSSLKVPCSRPCSPLDHVVVSDHVFVGRGDEAGQAEAAVVLHLTGHPHACGSTRLATPASESGGAPPREGRGCRCRPRPATCAVPRFRGWPKTKPSAPPSPRPAYAVTPRPGTHSSRAPARWPGRRSLSGGPDEQAAGGITTADGAFRIPPRITQRVRSTMATGRPDWGAAVQNPWLTRCRSSDGRPVPLRPRWPGASSRRGQPPRAGTWWRRARAPCQPAPAGCRQPNRSSRSHLSCPSRSSIPRTSARQAPPALSKARAAYSLTRRTLPPGGAPSPAANPGRRTGHRLHRAYPPEDAALQVARSMAHEVGLRPVPSVPARPCVCWPAPVRQRRSWRSHRYRRERLCCCVACGATGSSRRSMWSRSTSGWRGGSSPRRVTSRPVPGSSPAGRWTSCRGWRRRLRPGVHRRRPEEFPACVDAAARLLRPGGVLAVNGALAGGRVCRPAARDRRPWWCASC